MTTFLDFRYSRSLSGALFFAADAEEVEISLAAGQDNYLSFDVPPALEDDALFEVVDTDGVTVLAARLESGAVCLRGASGAVVLRTPRDAVAGLEGQPFSVRLGPHCVGVRLGDQTYEQETSELSQTAGTTTLSDGSARVLGRGTGRAMAWAELHYRRPPPTGRPVEMVIDWHNIRAGISKYSTHIAEKFIANTDFQLSFRSFAMGDEDAATGDFPRLFSSDAEPEVTIHFSPPIYTRRRPGTINVGAFMWEAMNVHPAVVRRCNLVDEVIVPSRFVAEAFRSSGVVRPMHLVPLGVDTDFFRPAASRTPLPGGRSFNFVGVSTFVLRKNMDVLVRAFLEEFRADEDVAFFLLARPEYFTTQQNISIEFEDWERRWAHDSAPMLLTTSYMSAERLRNTYANADCYVMPSNEGFGLTHLEAMSCGTPVVGLDYSAVPDFVNEQNGFLAPAGRRFVSRDLNAMPTVGDELVAPSLPGLRKAMRQAFEDRDETRRKGEQARKDCEARYTWDQIAAEMTDVLRSVQPNEEAARSFPLGRPEVLSWALLATDDEDVRGALADLSAAAVLEADVLCLFTHYVELNDVMRARKNGFLCYRWDGTLGNGRSIVNSMIHSRWAVMMRPSERLSVGIDRLQAFLAAQPEEVGEVTLECGDGSSEARLVRPDKFGSGERVAAPEDIRFVARGG